MNYENKEKEKSDVDNMRYDTTSSKHKLLSIKVSNKRSDNDVSTSTALTETEIVIVIVIESDKLLKSHSRATRWAPVY